jgi:hypothetical protein
MGQPKIEETAWGKKILDVDPETGAEVELGRIIKKRAPYVQDEEWSLEQNSMLGSWFHVVLDDDIIWQGVIVAEPARQTYLVEIDKLEPGADNVQRLFTVDTMLGLGEEARRLLESAIDSLSAPVIKPALEWRFYDSEGAALKAWQNWIAKRAQRLRDREEA